MTQTQDPDQMMIRIRELETENRRLQAQIGYLRDHLDQGKHTNELALLKLGELDTDNRKLRLELSGCQMQASILAGDNETLRTKLELAIGKPVPVEKGHQQVPSEHPAKPLPWDQWADAQRDVLHAQKRAADQQLANIEKAEKAGRAGTLEEMFKTGDS